MKFENKNSELEKEKLLESLSFTRDHVELEPGWYQDSQGDLFKYDGVVWNEVPSEPLKNLEYLGRE
jgi:hypothetical protein